MSARKVVLEVVTPDGPFLTERGLDAVVLRRREARFELGSEIAILPLHAPTLIRIPVAPARYRRGGRTFHLAVGGGFAEVERDRVLVVTPRCERLPPGEPDPGAAAREICRGWRRERVDTRDAMAGHPG
jgi:F-type H+-transporting ATPase subunit epsilon